MIKRDRLYGMTEANIRNGWKEPNERPEPNRPLLIVLRADEDKVEFVMTEYMGIKHARKRPGYTLLAWQYLPEWEETV